MSDIVIVMIAPGRSLRQPDRFDAAAMSGRAAGVDGMEVVDVATTVGSWAGASGTVVGATVGGGTVVGATVVEAAGVVGVTVVAATVVGAVAVVDAAPVVGVALVVAEVQRSRCDAFDLAAIACIAAEE